MLFLQYQIMLYSITYLLRYISETSTDAYDVINVFLDMRIVKS